MITRDKRHYENRIALLMAKDPEGNRKLIAKLERRKRKLSAGA